MRFKNFIGGSYTLQSVNVDAQRCINLYPEMDEMGTGKEGEIASLVGTPGLRLLCTLPTSPVRGVYFDSKGNLWAVGGNVLYQVSSAWAPSAVGTLASATGPVAFSDNGLQMVLVDGASGYQCTMNPASCTQITDPNFLGATTVAFMDGYLIFNEPLSQQFYLSPLNAVTPLSALDVGSAEAGPENLIGLIATEENLYLFSGKHFEVWYDSGNNNFPFQRTQGAVFATGCAAAQSIAKLGDTIFWLGQDKDGRGIVYSCQGLQTSRVSTFAIENVITSLGDLSTARAFTYQQGGHAFYCLNLPGATSTWCYDSVTGLWHERAYLSQGNYQRHLADCHAAAYSTNVVGDYQSGNLYALDPGTFTDNGNPKRWERSAPHLSKDMARLFHSSFQLDLETGVGTSTGQGANPQVMLQWSNDGGHTWSNEHWKPVGPIGQRKTRVLFWRLGQARDRVYRVRGSDPVKTTLIGAELGIEEGVS